MLQRAPRCAADEAPEGSTPWVTGCAANQWEGKKTPPTRIAGRDRPRHGAIVKLNPTRGVDEAGGVGVPRRERRARARDLCAGLHVDSLCTVHAPRSDRRGRSRRRWWWETNAPKECGHANARSSTAVSSRAEGDHRQGDAEGELRVIRGARRSSGSWRAGEARRFLAMVQDGRAAWPVSPTRCRREGRRATVRRSAGQHRRADRARPSTGASDSV